MSVVDLKVALTGATGYVGGLLIEPLSDMVGEVRCISRNPGNISRVLPSNVTAHKADVTDFDSLRTALAGCDVAFYLVHSLAEQEDFYQIETRSAQTFADAAKSAGIKRIIYLGALAQSDQTHTSAHIESRHHVGELLKSTGVPVTEFRASVIIGAGSMPFEAIRALVERLPVMVTPRWVRMPVQPIAAPDLVKYLSAAITAPDNESHIYEIGGADVTNYAKLMHTYAKARGLRRFMVPVPVITPRLSSLWLKLVTPAHYRIGKRIVDSAAHSSIVVDESAKRDFDFEPIGVEEAITGALKAENENLAFLDLPDRPLAGTQKRRIGTKFVERRSVKVAAPPETAVEIVNHIGGTTGWYWGTGLWKLRGLVDRMVGGPGMRSSATIFPLTLGATLDFWTIERMSNGHLTLHADMKLPGEAWLDLSVESDGAQTYVVQTAAFDPRGLLGIGYWFGLYPMHSLVFRGMLRGIRQETERLSGFTAK